MEGLAVAASVAGLVQVAAKAIDLISNTAGASSTARNVLTEVNALQAIFHQLQDFILDSPKYKNDRKLMINVEQLVTTLTGCLCAFNDLEKVLENLKTTNTVVGPAATLWRNAKWALVYTDVKRILGDLQMHKSSLNLMITIMTWYASS